MQRGGVLRWVGEGATMPNEGQLDLLGPPVAPQEPPQKPQGPRWPHGVNPRQGYRRCDAGEVEEALRAHGGVKCRAAKALGIDRTTLYRYVKEYDLEHVCDEARKELVDMAEETIFDTMRGRGPGSLTAAIFVTKCFGKSRGWVDRVVLEHSGSITHKTGAEDLDRDELVAAASVLIRGNPEPQGGQ